MTAPTAEALEQRARETLRAICTAGADCGENVEVIMSGHALAAMLQMYAAAIAAMLTASPPVPDEVMEKMARVLAPHLQGGRTFDAMPIDKAMLRAWVRSGETLDCNDATRSDAYDAARAALSVLSGSYGGER